MSVRRMLAVTCVGPLVLVAGCQADEPEPKMPTASPSASSTSPATPTPTVDPLAIPAEAKKPTKAGAEALVRHFWDMVAYLIQSGDAKPVRDLYRPGCEYCAAGVDFYQSAFDDGTIFTGGNESPSRIRLSLLDSNSNIPAAYAVVTTTALPQVQRDAGGKVLARIPGGSATKDYYLEFEAGAWIIANIEDPK